MGVNGKWGRRARSGRREHCRVGGGVVNVVWGSASPGVLCSVSIEFLTECVEAFLEAGDCQAEQRVVVKAILKAFDLRCGGSSMFAEVGYDASTNVDQVCLCGIGVGVHGGAEAIQLC